MLAILIIIGIITNLKMIPLIGNDRL
jgi:hypothetical protein